MIRDVTDIDRTKETNSLKWHLVFHKKRTWLLSLIPISLLLVWLAQNNAHIAEYVFARGVYRWLSHGINLVTGILPFSIMEIEIVVLPILLVILAIRFAWRLIYKASKKLGGIGYIVAEGILNMACTLSILLFLFVLLTGTNYYRYPFSHYSGLNIQEATVEELYYLSLGLAEEGAELRAQLQGIEGAEDENGVLRRSQDGWKELSITAKESFEKIAEEYPVLGGNYGAPKPVFFSRFMSRMNTTGIFWPFTMEANVNVDVAEYSIPVTMMHELAHLRGFMREDEANFIAYLVCKQSDNVLFQYSGIMLALSYAGNELYRQDPGLYKQVQELYNTGMRADLREEYYYWKQFEDTVISTVSNTMNDNYLKVNNQNDGVKSYGRMVDLLLAEYRKDNTFK